MSRLLVVLVIAALIQLLLVWTFAHVGLIVIGACLWAARSWWKGRQHA